MKLLNILFLLLFNLNIAQSISSDWTPIYSDDESVIYLNSTKILGYGNEISAWAIENFDEITYLENGDKISRVKTHYLFDKMKKRFVEIGIIYYDSKGQIVNRSSNSNLQGTSAAFMVPIKSDPKVEIIFKEVVSFLITGNVNSIDEVSVKNNAANVDDQITMEFRSDNRQEAESNKEEVAISPTTKGNSKSDESVDKGTEYGAVISTAAVTATEKKDATGIENWNEIPKIDERLEIEKKPTLSENHSKSELNKTNLDNSINIQVPSEKEYNASREKALKNSIFTDGRLYCFQVSSWKTESYAKRELNKLLDEGFDAFILSVKPAHKNSIWHRVRVGFFSSLEETRRVQKLVGKR